MAITGLHIIKWNGVNKTPSNQPEVTGRLPIFFQLSKAKNGGTGAAHDLH